MHLFNKKRGEGIKTKRREEEEEWREGGRKNEMLASRS